MRKILPVIVLFVFSIFFSVSAFSQYPDPKNCDNGDDTDWGQLQTGWTINIPAEVLGCDDPDCVVTIKYYVRTTSWGIEFQVTEISFSSACDISCIDNAWTTALWMLAVKHKNQMGLHKVGDCYDNFIYTVPTCWKTTTTFGTVHKNACGSDCCSGVYKICLIDVNGIPYFEFTQTVAPYPITFNCIYPCKIVDCLDLIPPDLQVPHSKPDQSAYEVFPKQSVHEQGSSNSMELRPNPTMSSVNIRIAVPESGVFQLNVIDNIGHTVHSQSLAIGVGLVFELVLTTQEYATGNYNVVLTNNSGLILNQQFIKIK